eukprot:Blabericola_migrator_1__8079@NODE_415_length_8708_cov_199_498322_g327_i0_p1_GENE_NODE_415_length_8708_cov_199_498322_g327_i0NODE_415_length_8708_cov_199_498322_g327_i0_p1_ORF_typecomplete_len1365_score161_71IQ/PF00612_27/0_17_NODE_415_length_8708_cov_199_498322_g327_i036367730
MLTSIQSSPAARVSEQTTAPKSSGSGSASGLIPRIFVPGGRRRSKSHIKATSAIRDFFRRTPSAKSHAVSPVAATEASSNTTPSRMDTTSEVAIKKTARAVSESGQADYKLFSVPSSFDSVHNTDEPSMISAPPAYSLRHSKILPQSLTQDSTNPHLSTNDQDDSFDDFHSEPPEPKPADFFGDGGGTKLLAAEDAALSSTASEVGADAPNASVKLSVTLPLPGIPNKHISDDRSALMPSTCSASTTHPSRPGVARNSLTSGSGTLRTNVESSTKVFEEDTIGARSYQHHHHHHYHSRRAATSSGTKWAVHPLSLETYTSIATSPGPMCDVSSSATEDNKLTADDLMASPARRLHRFLTTPKIMLRLEKLNGDQAHMQPVEEKCSRRRSSSQSHDSSSVSSEAKNSEPTSPAHTPSSPYKTVIYDDTIAEDIVAGDQETIVEPAPPLVTASSPSSSSHTDRISELGEAAVVDSDSEEEDSEPSLHLPIARQDFVRQDFECKESCTSSYRSESVCQQSSSALTVNQTSVPYRAQRRALTPPARSPAAVYQESVYSSIATVADNETYSARPGNGGPASAPIPPDDTDDSETLFPDTSPFLRWMVNTSKTANAPSWPDKPQESRASYNPFDQGESPNSAAEAGVPISTQFETANEDFISAQETQDEETAKHHGASSPVKPPEPTTQEGETTQLTSTSPKESDGKDGDTSSAERRRHKSPVQRIMSALTKKLFPPSSSDGRTASAPKAGTPLHTEHWSADHSLVSACQERKERQARMKETFARVLDENSSLHEGTPSSSAFEGMNNACHELKLRCFPRILTPVRASTCTGTTRAVSHNTAARKHVSTFSQPTPPSSRVVHRHKEDSVPGGCSCHYGGPSEVSSSLTSGLKFAMPQPRTASSVGASSWKRCINGPVVMARGEAYNSRPTSSSSSHRSSEMSLLSPPRGGMRTLVGVFSAVEDAALKKYYDCLEDLRRRGDPLASTLGSEMLHPPQSSKLPDDSYQYGGRPPSRCHNCNCCSQVYWPNSQRPEGVGGGSQVSSDCIITGKGGNDRNLQAEACMEVSVTESDFEEDEETNSSCSRDVVMRREEPRTKAPPEMMYSPPSYLSSPEDHIKICRIPAPRQYKRDVKCGIRQDNLYRNHPAALLQYVRSAPLMEDHQQLTEEEAERRLRRFLAHVVMKRRLKRIKLLQDSATKIQRWYRSTRRRYYANSSLASVDMSPCALPPPRHRYLPDGRILNVPRVVRETPQPTWAIKQRGVTTSSSSRPNQMRCSHHSSRKGRVSSSYMMDGTTSTSNGPFLAPYALMSNDTLSLISSEDWTVGGTTASDAEESCHWRRPCCQERDVTIRVLPRPPVKVTMNRTVVTRRF